MGEARRRKQLDPSFGNPKAPKFDVNDGQWSATYYRHGEGMGFSEGNFSAHFFLLNIDFGWKEELEALASIYGCIEFGDDDFGLIIYHDSEEGDLFQVDDKYLRPRLGR